jgi:hypothetical protein
MINLSKFKGSALSFPRLRERIGLDKAVFFTASGRVWSLLAGPVSLFLVATRLSKEEQGFYYTIGSLLAMRLLFELGLMQLITQFAAHEMADLHLDPDGGISGNDINLRRLGNLLRRAVFWFSAAAGLLVLIVTPVGVYWLSSPQNSEHINWVWPWVLSVFVTGLSLAVTPVLACLNGIGFISEVARFAAIQSMVGSLAAWFVLLQGGALYAVPVQLAIVFMSGSMTLLVKYRKLLRRLFEIGKLDSTFNWRKEVWPLQWRAGIGWFCGWFIFQLFTPFVFRFQGAVAAGKLGMALNIINQFSVVTRSWIEMRVPSWGRLIAQRKSEIVFSQFYHRLKVSTCIYIGGSGVGLLLLRYFVPHFFPSLSGRILDLPLFALLFFGFGVTHIVNAIALLVRSFKREPFLIMTLVNSGLVTTGLLTLGQWYGVFGVISVFVLVQLIVVLPWACLIFRRNSTYACL